jgi:hypothetical protein
LIHGADGEVGGLFAAEGNATFDRSDIYFSADLDPDTPAVLAVENTSWLSSGGAQGGVGFFTQRDNPQSPRRIEGAWLVGDEVAVGGAARLALYAWDARGVASVHADLLLASTWLPRAVSIPVVFGELGVAPGFRIGPVPVGADGTVVFDVTVPPDPALVGIGVPLQALVESRSTAGRPQWTLTNTAVLRVR